MKHAYDEIRKFENIDFDLNYVNNLNEKIKEKIITLSYKDFFDNKVDIKLNKNKLIELINNNFELLLQNEKLLNDKSIVNLKNEYTSISLNEHEDIKKFGELIDGKIKECNYSLLNDSLNAENQNKNKNIKIFKV